MTYSAKSPDQYRIVLQQDAPEPMLRAEVEHVTPQTLLDHSIRQFEHLPIDVYGSDANHAGGVYYRSKVAERLLSDPSTYRGRDTVRLADRLQALFDAGTDPLEIYCRGAHAAGIDFMIQLRMNDLHDVVGIGIDVDEPVRAPEKPRGEPYYYTSGFKRDHPELMLGDPTDDTPPNTYPFWQRSALNYALDGVRAHFAGMARELVDNYDLDVLELDFIRFTFYFRQAEAYAQRHVLTGLVRSIRDMCAEAGARRGRPVRLAARVPDTFELGLRAGVDTGAWLQQGLLDLVTIGGGYCPFGTPWQEIADAARRAGVPVLACLNHGNFAKDVRRIHAAAHRAHCAGVNGFKLWNFWYCFDYYHPRGANPLKLDFVRDLAEPARLAQNVLSYQVDRIQDPSQLVGSAHFHHTWPGQTPLTIGVAADGIGQVVTMDVPGPVMAARQAEHPALLVLDLLHFWALEDRLELYWNGERIEDVHFELMAKEGGEPCRAVCRLTCGRIEAGPNRLELRLVGLNPRMDPFIDLNRAELMLPDSAGHLPADVAAFAERLY